MSSVPLLFDEHVDRVFERVLRDRGYRVIRAREVFGDETVDDVLLRWCAENDTVLVSNNVKDFEPLHRQGDHAGILLYHDQSLPTSDPEGLARAVEAVLEQYGPSELANSLVELDEWYDWLHG